MDYRRDIDGLRCVAVFLVILFHAKPNLLPGGFIGVDVFFVISGFLIGSLLIKELDNDGISVLRFYARRLRRVAPALLLVIVCTVSFGGFYLSPDEMGELAHSASAAALGVSNIYFWRTTSYFASSAELNPLLATWSLGVEEQFYLVTPVLLIVVARWRRSMLAPVIAALCIGSLTVSIVMTYRWPSAAYYLLPSRWFELGAGLLLAALWTSPLIARLRQSQRTSNFLFATGLGLILVAAALVSRSHRFPGALALLPTVGAALIILAERSSWAARSLGSASAVWGGKLSYSIYLWHWPLLSFARIGTGGEISDGAVALIVLAVLPLSYLTWRFVETPCRHMAWSSGLTVAGAIVAAGTTAAVSIAAGWASQSFSLLPQAVADIEAQAGRLRHDKCLSGGSEFVLPPEGCRDFMAATVALVGDSHAAALAPALQRIAKAKGYGFAQLTRSNCPPLISARREMVSWPSNGISCEQHNRFAFSLIKSDARIRVVVLSAFWSAPFLNRERDADGSYVETSSSGPTQHETIVMRAGLDKTIKEMEAMGKRVVIVGDVPVFRFNPMVLEKSRLSPLRTWVADYAAKNSGTAGSGTSIDTETGPPIANILLRGTMHPAFIDAEALLCRDKGCRFRANAGLLYTDHHHLSDAGASFILAPVEPMLDRFRLETALN